ncbi:hypothetical protein SASPL_148455 [Salvia splendens]|uniref:Clp ATPase C-terminal domain-containing protein n=1 Tax=Salvia splendens TaxID=180675 RepID=A0A8X8W9B2_SALSN|nr:hypothetical protein SASPL_148455 [Salvia splendens]
MKKASKSNEEASVNKALEPTSEETIVLSEDEVQLTGIFVKRRSGKGKGSLIKGSPVKKSRKKAVDAEDLNVDIMISPVKKSRRKTVVPEDLKEDIVILVLNVSLCLHKMMPDLLKYLHKPKRKCAMSKEEHIEKDPALERRFQPVRVPEPTVDEAIVILKGLRERYEIHHKLHYTDEALVAAAQLSHQYISDRFLPDKAIDLIDEAGSRVRLKHAKLPEEAKELEKEIRQITKEKNEAVRSQDFEKLSCARNFYADIGAGELCDTEMDLRAPMSGLVEKNKDMVKAESIPVEKVSIDESDRLLKMEETLHTRVIGQDEAVKAISRAIRSKALATYYFGSEEAMIRLDMSEFMERDTVSKLIGSPPGYVGYTEGGQLTEAVRRRPYTVVLFDEIEKAHPDVFNMMLQTRRCNVIEKGGRRIGFDLDYDEKDNSYNRIKSLVTEELKQYFRPEFLNRLELDEMIVFRQLTKLEVKQISDIMLEGRDIELNVTERFRDRVVDEGYDPSYGARPLRRAIMRLLEDSMAEKMLASEIKEGDSVIVDVDSGGKVVVLNGSSGARPEPYPEPVVF